MDGGAPTSAPQPRPRAASRRARVATSGALVLGLLLVVALASTAGGALSDGGSGRAPSRAFVDYAYTSGLLVVLAMIGAVAWLLRPSGRWKETEGRAPLHLGPLLIALAVLVTLLIAITRLWKPSIAAGERTLPGETGGALPGAATTAAATQHEPEFRWPVLAVILLLVAGGVAAAALARRRRPSKAPSSPQEFVAELTTLLDLALDDLRAEADPRRAVIAAYARMERALAAFGLPRRAFEAPFEYLERIANALVQTLPAARNLVFELTHLFERAKFSPHEIDAGMKTDAVETLTELRDQVVAANAEREPAVA